MVDRRNAAALLEKTREKGTLPGGSRWIIMMGISSHAATTHGLTSGPGTVCMVERSEGLHGQ